MDNLISHYRSWQILQRICKYFDWNTHEIFQVCLSCCRVSSGGDDNCQPRKSLFDNQASFIHQTLLSFIKVYTHQLQRGIFLQSSTKLWGKGWVVSTNIMTFCPDRKSFDWVGIEEVWRIEGRGEWYWSREKYWEEGRNVGY